MKDISDDDSILNSSDEEAKNSIIEVKKFRIDKF